MTSEKSKSFAVIEAAPQAAIDHLTTCVDEHYLSQEKSADMDRFALRVIQLINGYIRSTLTLRTAAS